MGDWRFMRLLQVEIDMAGVEQLVETSQTKAVGDAMSMLAKRAMPKGLSFPVKKKKNS